MADEYPATFPQTQPDTAVQLHSCSGNTPEL
jgi:hypothetical protein